MQSIPPSPHEFSIPDHEYRWTPGTDANSSGEIAAFFESPPIAAQKAKLCDIGRRMWQKDYVDGNGGNITVRVGDNLVLCTPTLISKGFMTPEDICLVDLSGRQLAGRSKRTSEAMTHLGIMQRQPLAKSCVHAHPPHATAYALGVDLPVQGLLTEAEIFLGVIGFAKYQTPGSPANAVEIGEVGSRHQATVMANHGVIVWGNAVEDAYWKLEIIDAYFKTIGLATQLGAALRPIPAEKMAELIRIRKSLGMPDARPS